MPQSKLQNRINEAIQILTDLGMPRAQLNERSAISLLALLNLKSDASWDESSNPLIGITPIMNWVLENYQKEYAPNTRETFRRQTMHQFVDAGIAAYNPDKPDRPVNSPAAVYQITPECLTLIQAYKSESYPALLKEYLLNTETLVAQYQNERKMNMVPITVNGVGEITLSPGEHSELIKSLWEDFGSRFTPGGILVYVGDTGAKTDYFDEELLAKLNVSVDKHGKLPDVVIYSPDKNILVLAESVTSHGPVDSKRIAELSELFKGSTAELVYVSGFPNKTIFKKYLDVLAWGSFVWLSDNPSHLISFGINTSL